MSESYIGEIRMFGFGFAPKGWALCNGQILAINQNQALFSILGTTYGGNGVTTFALPDLRGRVPIHMSSQKPLGMASGEEAHTLTINEMPTHMHQVSGSSTTGDQKVPTGNVWATRTENPFIVANPDVPMIAGAMGTAGGSQPHSNMQPYQTVSFCICISGIFPSRN